MRRREPRLQCLRAEDVLLVALDMSDAYKGFARRTLPDARLVAYKLHALRLRNTRSRGNASR